MPTAKKIDFILGWKTEIISSAIVLACLLLASLFPVRGSFQVLSNNLFFLLVLPVLYIMIILKKNPGQFGFNLENRRTGFSWALGMLLVSLVLMLFPIYFFDFAHKYALPKYINRVFWLFLIYELGLVNFVLFIYEFFFKGFLLFLLDRKIGYWSIIIQALVFILFLISTRMISWQLVPMIILAFTGGVTAYKSRSFIYSYLMSLFFMLILDAYMIFLTK
jgi:hypothetical protein